MTDLEHFGARSWGVSVAGGIVSLGSAEAAAILSAASGLARTLFLTAGSGLTLATGLVGLYLYLDSRHKGIAINAMSWVRSEKRSFKGVCISETLDFKSCGDRLSVPVEYIEKIKKRSIFGDGTSIYLFDGSRYDLGTPLRGGPSLRFLTPIGEQNVSLNSSLFGVRGCEVTEVQRLRDSLSDFFDKKDEDVVKLIGKRNFERYFYSGR